MEGSITPHAGGIRGYFASHPWKEALLWLCLLAPFFFITYGFANHFTASRAHVGVCVFAWERHIPFWPWTIIPYWSIDFFYGLSLFVCATRQELRMQVSRLALSTIICVTGFLLFPLRMSFPQPRSEGVFGTLFAALGAFDLPYNQAPSLHICLLLVLWDCYRRHVPCRWLPLLHGWSLLIGLSVLTTYQHHSIDVLTGLAAGIVCCYIVPRTGWQRWRTSQPPKAHALALRYGLGAVVCTLLAMVCGFWFSPWAWWLLWPALALGCVALGYGGLGPQVMQKAANGTQSFAARCLLAPYRLVAALSRRYYLARLPLAVEIVPHLWLGAYPPSLPAQNCAVLDLCAEYPQAPAARKAVDYACVPMLDLLAPTAAELGHAVHRLEAMHTKGPVLVHCALGLTRSAAVVACWLAQHQGIELNAALDVIRAKRPQMVLGPSSREALHRAFAQYTSLPQFRSLHAA